LRVMHDGRPVTVEVTSDGAGVVSHAGTALVAQVADKVGLTQALSLRLAAIKQRRRGHDPGRVIRDLAVIVADGGECVSDLGAVREQDALFGAVASDSTAFRMVDRIASTPGLLDAVRQAHARAPGRWRRSRPSTSRLWRSWCARTRPALRMVSLTLPRGQHALLGRLRADRDRPRRDPPDPRERAGTGARPGRLGPHERRGL
jgi:hypothetical protein